MQMGSFGQDASHLHRVIIILQLKDSVCQISQTKHTVEEAGITLASTSIVSVSCSVHAFLTAAVLELASLSGILKSLLSVSWSPLHRDAEVKVAVSGKMRTVRTMQERAGFGRRSGMADHPPGSILIVLGCIGQRPRIHAALSSPPLSVCRGTSLF